MIIYNPKSTKILPERIRLAEQLLSEIKAKHCFITGSFLYKDSYKDIDIFVITRSKTRIIIKNKKAKVAIIDFNSLYSLFYHSAKKCCISKSILPEREVKATASDYWNIINEAVPIVFNSPNNYKKNIRFLVLYTEYFKEGNILDSYELSKKIESIKSWEDVIGYVKSEVPKIINAKIKKSYIKRFFYTQAGYYKDSTEYKAQRFLYELSHLITRCAYDEH
jgi:hypothetical protein